MKLDPGISELVKAFREARLAKMDSGDIPVSLAEGAATVIHLVPASAFEPGAAIDLATVARERSRSALKSLRNEERLEFSLVSFQLSPHRLSYRI